MKPGTLLATLMGVGFIIGGFALLHPVPHERFVIPDEKAAAAALLGQKLSGPRYFQASSPSGADLPTIRAPFLRERAQLISVTDALAQVDRLAAERHLDQKNATKIRQLIDQLAEPPNSRMVGDASVNLLRLNLALDELR